MNNLSINGFVYDSVGTFTKNLTLQIPIGYFLRQIEGCHFLTEIGRVVVLNYQLKLKFNSKKLRIYNWGVIWEWLGVSRGDIDKQSIKVKIQLKN